MQHDASEAFKQYREVYQRKWNELRRRILIHSLTGDAEDPTYSAMTTDELLSRCYLRHFAGVETEDEMWATPTEEETS